MTVDPFSRWQLTPVINAAGTMTRLGASRVPAETRDVVDAILQSFVDMDELQSRACWVIAKATGAEAGCVVSSSSAAITLAIAATITGADLAAIEALPDAPGAETRVILQAGHDINYGAPVHQAIALAGGKVVRIGTAANCEIFHLRQALAAGATAALYVVSHHTVREGEIPLELFVSLCAEFGVPVIVDMAAEYDLTGPVALGAAVAIYSGHKFLSGSTSGIIAGKLDLIRATYLQNRGIGRKMKVGKEGVAGAMAALEAWAERDHEKERASEEARVARWIEALDGVCGLRATPSKDWTGNPITRARITVAPDTVGFFAWELVPRLSARRPSISVRDDLVEHGEFYLDPCNVDDGEAELVAQAIREEARALRASGTGLSLSWSEVKRQREAAVLSWPQGEPDAP